MLPNALSGPICECATAIALLPFALKRLWAIDLELRAHRERQRARFHEARRSAREALPKSPRIGGRADVPTLGPSKGQPRQWRQTMDMKLELIAVPVSDVDRAKAFYTEKAGFNADHDHRVSDEIRFVQLTPPGSACSIAIGKGVTKAQPGSVEGLQLVVEDADAARAELLERGVEVGEVQEFPWGRFVFFSDPDGNGWAVQQANAQG